MKQMCVITGIGVLLPETRSLDKLWSDCSTPTDASQNQRGAAASESFVAKELYDGCISSRLSKKLDAFTRYALAATKYAIDDASLDMDELDKERCGVFVGNCFGGWLFTEVELRNLHCDGPRSVSPFQATSWFPAAPRGQITIHYGLKGYSKTFMADRASSLLSVSAGAEQIKQGKLDIAVAGGTESTNTDFVRAALRRLHTDGEERKSPLLPFEMGHDGFAVSEGAVFLVMESKEHAVTRGAKIYGRVDDFVLRNSPCETNCYGVDPIPFVQSMTRACCGEKPDLVMPDACGLTDCDSAEAGAISQTFDRVKLSYPKARLKHTFGAEGALDIALACLMIKRQQILPTYSDELVAPLTTEQISGEPQSARLDHILINARATGGAIGSLVVARMEA